MSEVTEAPVPLGDLSKIEDAKIRLNTINDFKNVLENATDSALVNSLQQESLAPLLEVLKSSDATFTSSSIEHQIRLAAVETLQRFTFNDAFKPLVDDLMRTILDLLRNDNEEIACVCLKIFIDLHKTYKTGIEAHMQPFLDIVLKIYQNMPETVRESFSNISLSSTAARLPRSAITQSPQVPNSPLNPSDPIETNPQVTSKTLNKSMNSFRVLTECPIIIVLLFSTYRQSVQTNLVSFTPAIIEMLSLQAPPAQDSPKLSAASAMRKQVFADFMLAQIKTLSFLAYVLRGFTSFMKKYTQIIPQFVLRLLHECPPEMSAARKVRIRNFYVKATSDHVGTARGYKAHSVYRLSQRIHRQD